MCVCNHSFMHVYVPSLIHACVCALTHSCMCMCHHTFMCVPWYSCQHMHVCVSWMCDVIHQFNLYRARPTGWCHTHEWVTWHTWTSRVILMNVSCVCDTWMCHVCVTHECVMCVWHMNVSCDTRERVLWSTWMSLVSWWLVLHQEATPRGDRHD